MDIDNLYKTPSSTSGARIVLRNTSVLIKTLMIAALFWNAKDIPKAIGFAIYGDLQRMPYSVWSLYFAPPLLFICGAIAITGYFYNPHRYLKSIISLSILGSIYFLWLAIFIVNIGLESVDMEKSVLYRNLYLLLAIIPVVVWTSLVLLSVWELVFNQKMKEDTAK